MCKHADHTKEMIDHLLTEVYPSLDRQIDNAMRCHFLQSSTVPEKDLVVDTLINLKNEFHSLATYEEKLVFPSVLKVFNAKNEQTVLPNLGDLLQLTKSKEHKINHYIKQIERLVGNHLWKTTLQENLVDTFNNKFVAEKLKWNKMIQDRIASCGCFKKNYFEMVRLYKNDALNSSNNSSNQHANS